jgi:hypothetical protein
MPPTEPGECLFHARDSLTYDVPYARTSNDRRLQNIELVEIASRDRDEISGDLIDRYTNSQRLILMGWNSFGIRFPSGWGSNAVPAAGTCAGVKYGTVGPGLFAGGYMLRGK